MLEREKRPITDSMKTLYIEFDGRRPTVSSKRPSWAPTAKEEWDRVAEEQDTLDYPPVRQRARLSRNAKAALTARLQKVRESLLKDESVFRKGGPDFSDSSGRRFAVPFKYIELGETENALQFMAFWDKKGKGCGEPYFSLAQALVVLAKRVPEGELSLEQKKVQQEAFNKTQGKNQYVCDLLAKETFIADASDEYGCVARGGKHEAHNVVEAALGAFQHVPGAMDWVKSEVWGGKEQAKKKKKRLAD